MIWMLKTENKDTNKTNCRKHKNLFIFSFKACSELAFQQFMHFKWRWCSTIIILPLADLLPCVDECVENYSAASTSSKNHYSCLSRSSPHVGGRNFSFFFSVNRKVVMHCMALCWFCFNEVTSGKLNELKHDDLFQVFCRRISLLKFTDGSVGNELKGLFVRFHKD